jgi:hypothetical protein
MLGARRAHVNRPPRLRMKLKVVQAMQIRSCDFRNLSALQWNRLWLGYNAFGSDPHGCLQWQTRASCEQLFHPNQTPPENGILGMRS